MRRAVVAILVEEHDRSVVFPCQIAGLSRTEHYRPPAGPEVADAPIITSLTTLIAQEGSRGFWMCRKRLRDL